MIGALQKILSKTTEPDTKNGVEEYVLLDNNYNNNNNYQLNEI